MRKRLAITQREIVIGKDKSRCHHELLRQSGIYPFDVYCPNCSKDMKYKDEIIFHKKVTVEKFVENWADKFDGFAQQGLIIDIDLIKEMLKEYDEIKSVA